MVQRPSSTIVALLWLLALVDGQETPKDGSTLQPAEVLGMGLSPASPLFARGMLDIRQVYTCVDSGFFPCDRRFTTT